MKMSVIKAFFWLTIGFFILTSISLAGPDRATQDLFLACQANNKEKVLQSMAKGAAVDATDARGYTPLYYAAQSGSREIMDLLLENGVDINRSVALDTEEFGRTKIPILLWAVESGDPNMVEYLLEKGANRDVQDSQGVAVLCLAVNNNNFEVFKHIADKDADLNKRYKIGHEHNGTLLHAAVAGGNVKIVEYLLDRKVDIEARDSQEYSPLYLAALSSNLPIAKLLVERGAYIYSDTSYGRSIFNNFVGSRKVVDYFHQVEQEKYQPQKEPPAWMRFIEKREWGFQVDIRGISKFVQNGGRVDEKDQFDNTLLHFVAGKNLGNSDILAVLVDKLGVDVNAVNVHGQTPLHNAAQENWVENVAYLLDHDADVHARDKQSNTALNIMANFHFNAGGDEESEIAITKMLLAKGADVNACNVFGNTALSRIADDNMDRHTDWAKLLIDNGANVNHQTNVRRTTLHMAAEMGSVQMVKMLLGAGARTNIYDIYGRSAIQMARYDAQEKWDLMFEYRDNVSVIEAVYYSQEEILEDIINSGTDIESVYEADNSSTGLIVATKKNDANMVKKLLELGANINAQDSLGYTSLHYAASNGHDDVIWLLLESGADAQIKTHQGQSAMDLAVANDKLRSVQLIKDARPDLAVTPSGSVVKEEETVASQESEKVISQQQVSDADMKAMRIQQLAAQVQSPLHKAVLEGDLELVRKMLKDGSEDVDGFDNLGSTPLMYAAYIGHQEVAKLLLEYGADIDSQNEAGLSCLHIAVFGENKEMVRLLLESGVDVSLETIDEMNALEAAIMTQQDEIAKIIQEANPNLVANVEQWNVALEDDFENMEDMETQIEEQENMWKMESLVEESNNPFHVAVIKGELEKVKKLIESGNVDVNGEDSSGRLCISYAACMKNKEMVDLLLKHGADINKIDHHPWLQSGWGFTIGVEGGWGSLHYAVDTGNVEMLEFMIARGADVNMKATKETGINPLYMAVKIENVNMIKAILKGGANWNLYYDNGSNTILHDAAQSGKIKRMQLICDLGADIEARDKWGNTPLMSASASGEDDALIYLLKRGADLHAVDNDGGNALHGIIYSKETTETVRILVEYGIDINHRNNDGSPPIFPSGYTSTIGKDLLTNAKFLIQEGAVLTVQNNREETLLHLAVNHSYVQLASLAIEHGAEINAQDTRKETPLHGAVKMGNVLIANLLLEAGARSDIPNSDGHTAEYFANHPKKKEILSLFQ